MVIDEEEKGIDKKYRLKQKQVQFIQTLVLVSVLDNLFQEGAKAAKETVDSMEDLGMSGFVVGETEFIGRNENVIRGDKLSLKLRQNLSSYAEYLDRASTNGLGKMIKELMRKVKYGRTMD